MKALFSIVTWFFSLSLILAQEFSKEVKPFISVHQPIVAISNTTVIDGTGNNIRYNQTLILKEGLIHEIGNDDSVDIPESAMRISGEGKTVIPGHYAYRRRD
jgi:hypothetical protein